MIPAPLICILLKVFAGGFYQKHAGILFFIFFILFGMVEPSHLISYHEGLMLAFISSPLMMIVVFAAWLLYTFKSWHYVAGDVYAIHQQFLFYSVNSYTKSKQFIAWLAVQVSVSLPFLAYAVISAGVAVKHQYFLSAGVIIGYILALLSISALFYTQLIAMLVDGSKQSRLLRLTRTWKKPWFSLFLYHIFDQLKLTWAITKVLSYLIITGVFLMFADVSTDLRVAGIAVLAIAVAHSVMIFSMHQFAETYLSFSRNLPYTRTRLFAGFAGVYFAVMLPEGIWLFSRFDVLMAAGLLTFSLSVMMLFHSLLYGIGPDMEKYMTRVFVLFIVLFWVVMFKLVWALTAVNLGMGFLLLYVNYYRYSKVLVK